MIAFQLLVRSLAFMADAFIRILASAMLATAALLASKVPFLLPYLDD